MHIKKTMLVAGLLLFNCAASADALSRFSVSLPKMRSFARTCVKVPDFKSMEADIVGWEQQQKTKSKNFSFTLDGFPFANASDADFLAMRTLTIPRGAHGSFKDRYRFSMDVDKENVLIQRSCLSPTCGATDSKEKKFDLSAFTKKSQAACSSALCGAQRIFGDQQGPMILWSFVKFGSNLSPLSDPMADPAGLDIDTLKAIIGASLLTPDHLKTVALKDLGFFRYQKGRSLPIYHGQKVVANSFGGVFDPIDELTYPQKVYFFVHELAHRARLREKPALDESPEWLKVAGWNDSKTPSDVSLKISQYARVNPFEDFAETYSLYRLDPTRLKALSPTRYQYMRDRVFDGIEYDQDLCTGALTQNQARRE